MAGTTQLIQAYDDVKIAAMEEEQLQGVADTMEAN